MFECGDIADREGWVGPLVLLTSFVNIISIIQVGRLAALV